MEEHVFDFFFHFKKEGVVSDQECSYYTEVKLNKGCELSIGFSH